MKNKDGGDGEGRLNGEGGLNKGFMVIIETVAFTFDLSFRSVAQK